MQQQEYAVDRTRLSVTMEAFKDSIPVFMAYFPLGIVFGILFSQLDYAWYFAPLMSFFIYSGLIQFMAISVIAVHDPVWGIVIPSIFVAMRTSFYGLSLIDRYNTKLWKKLYLIHTIVDPSFAIFLNKERMPKEQEIQYALSLNFSLHAYWILGTLFGVMVGGSIPEIQGLDFSVTALLTVLSLDQFLKLRQMPTLIIAFVAGVAGLMISPENSFFISLGIAIVLLGLRYRMEVKS